MTSAADSTQTAGPVVATTAGRVRGRWRTGPDWQADRPDASALAAGTSAVFLGIPFAEAPIGALRFAAPQPPSPWEGVRDALVHGATPKREDSGHTLIPEPVVPGEATLNVDVFTPAPGDRAAHLPVMVWIHGGGYTEGSPASPWYDGASFTRDGVVTVTTSYRLGFDGFGCIPGAPDNRGVLDWLAALEWVRDNIEAFGGDPSRVTIAGQSAGGGAVLTLLGMPAAQGLFQGALSISGALGDVPREHARSVAARLAELAGVACTREGFASVPEERLTRLQAAAASPPSAKPLDVVVDLLKTGTPWGPMIDGNMIPRPTLESLEIGIGADKPVLLGAADDEFTPTTDPLRARLRLVPAGLALGKLGLDGPQRRAYLQDNRAQHRRGTAALVGRYTSDVVFRSTVARVANARSAAKESVTGAPSAPTWVYAFSWVSPTRHWAGHCLDVPFWFDCLGAPGVAKIAGPTPPQALATSMHTAAVRFIGQGDPGWLPWSTSPGATWEFDSDEDAADVGHLDAAGYTTVRALL